MSKLVAVLFSSGLDSTYLVWKNLKDGNEVIPIYIEVENNKIKSTIEKNRIKLLYDEFVKEFNVNGKINIHPIEYSISIDIKLCRDKLHFHQIPIWILSMLFSQCLGTYSRLIEEIQIGYVENDDAIPYLEDIKNIYNSYQVISEPLIPLVFPLVKVKKIMIAQELPEQ